MDKVKEFFVKAWTAIKENAKGVIEQYPYTVGAIYLLGMLTTLVLNWVLT